MPFNYEKKGYRLIMYKKIYGFSTLVLMLILGITCSVYAGDINANEARVISAAQGTFEYEGKTYVAKSEYVNQLIAKLSSDDVDLTADQASEAIAMIYSNVATGVTNGYIEEVAPADTHEEQPAETSSVGETVAESVGTPESDSSETQKMGESNITESSTTESIDNKSSNGDTNQKDEITRKTENAQDTTEDLSESITKADLSNIAKNSNKSSIAEKMIIGIVAVVCIAVAIVVCIKAPRRNKKRGSR